MLSLSHFTWRYISMFKYEAKPSAPVCLHDNHQESRVSWVHSMIVVSNWIYLLRRHDITFSPPILFWFHIHIYSILHLDGGFHIDGICRLRHIATFVMVSSTLFYWTFDTTIILIKILLLSSHFIGLWIGQKGRVEALCWCQWSPNLRRFFLFPDTFRLLHLGNV